MTDYTELIRSLRNCSNNRCAPCDCGWFDKYQVDESCKEIIMWKAAAAIEELDAEETRLLLLTSDLQDKLMDLQEQLNDSDVSAEDDRRQIEELQAEVKRLEPKRGEWNDHEVACLLAEMFGDDCACNLNGIDEWLPQYCEFAETCCPNPGGVACWEQFLKHRAKMEVQDGDK